MRRGASYPLKLGLLLISLALISVAECTGPQRIDGALARLGRSLVQTASYPFEGYWLQQSTTEQEAEGGQNAATAIAIGPGPLVWEAIGFLTKGQVKAFDSKGARAAQWGEKGSSATQIDGEPYDMDVDSGGNVYILDSKFVKKFTASGSLLSRWTVPASIPQPGEDYAPPYIMKGLAVDPTRGSIYVGVCSEIGYGVPGQLFKFRSDGTVEWRKDLNGTQESYEEHGAGKLAVDSAGFIYVIDKDGSGILRYDGNGNLIRRLNEASNTGGLTDIAVHSQMSRIFAAHATRAEVQIFSFSGSYSGAMGTQGDGAGPEEGTLIMPKAIAVDQSNGKVYVADEATFYIMRYNNGPLKPCTFYDTRCRTCLNPSTCAECKDVTDTLGADGRCIGRTCTDTDPNCLTCASNTACKTCKARYSVGIQGMCQSDDLADCKLTDPGCQVCVSMTVCFKCKAADYSPGLTGKCEPSIWGACRKTDPNCQYCKSATACNQCASVNYVVGPSGKCQLRDNLACTVKDPYCGTCSSATTCSVCKTPYVLGAAGKCRPRDCRDSDAQCKVCVNDKFCAECKTLAYYVNPKGVCVEACLANDPQCAKCKSAVRCERCKTAAYRVGASGKCEPTAGTTEACKKPIPACQKCATATRCQTCKAGFSITSLGKCQKSSTSACLTTDRNCATCASATRCGTCKAGFAVASNGKCTPITACLSYDAYCVRCATAKTCAQCQAGYAVNAVGQCAKSSSTTTACRRTDSYCVKCATATRCAQCQAGYAVNASGKCAKSSRTSACLAADPYCVTCATATRCAQCIPAFAVGGNGKCAYDLSTACVPTTPNCVVCATAQRCRTCRSGYFVNSNGKCQQSGGTTTRCKAADPYCRTCLNSNTCSTCVAGYSVSGTGKCRTSGGCLSRDGQCSVCKDSVTCKQCKDTENWAVDPLTGRCTRVGSCTNSDPNCRKCDIRRPSRCLVCKWFYALINGNRCTFWGF